MDDHDGVILGVIHNVAREKRPDLQAVEPGQLLVDDLGLTSLDLAAILAKLERKLGVDPFAEMVPVTSLRTAGDVCAAYRKCLAPDDVGTKSSDQAGPPVAPPPPRAQADLAAQRALRRQAREE